MNVWGSAVAREVSVHLHSLCIYVLRLRME